MLLAWKSKLLCSRRHFAMSYVFLTIVMPTYYKMLLCILFDYYGYIDCIFLPVLVLLCITVRCHIMYFGFFRLLIPEHILLSFYCYI